MCAQSAEVTVKSFTYDAAGRTTAVTVGNDTATLAYDYESRIGLPPRIEDVRKVVLWFKLEAIMKRSKFSEEQIVRILQEAASGQKTQA
ncbi:MAG: hypothetical protein KJZ62_11030 [Fimbriimonadaceae bacterium]|nr:hypothetical protein [Fimbriimonadaceae bacterium]